MSRKREAIFMGLGILAGFVLSGPAAQAADYLTAQPSIPVSQLPKQEPQKALAQIRTTV